jgi:hypothetical protein
MDIGKTDLLNTVGNLSQNDLINCLDCSLPENGTRHGAAHADQRERDHKAPTQAMRDGKLKVLIKEE